MTVARDVYGKSLNELTRIEHANLNWLIALRMIEAEEEREALAKAKAEAKQR